MLSTDIKDQVVSIILNELPRSEAIYLFGSMAKNNSTAESDVDLAIFIKDKPAAEKALTAKMKLARLFSKDIDLVDLLRADSITRIEVVANSDLLYTSDKSKIDFFETRVFAEYASLNEERKGILEDIVERGSVYG